MRVLFLLPSLPLPPTDGGKIRVLNLLLQTAKAHAASVIALETEPTDGDEVHTLRRQGIAATLVRGRSPKVPSLTLSSLGRAVVGGLPLSAAKYQMSAFRRAVAAEMAQGPYDLVHIEMMHLGPYLADVRRWTVAPVLLSTQNVDSDVWRRAAPYQPTPWRRWLFRWQAEVFERTERRLGPRFDGVTAASERDAAQYRNMLPGVPVEVVDNGVDLAAYVTTPDAEDPDTFVYTGSYDWLPNADAVIYFCAHIWPLVRKTLPDARFYAVGKEPTRGMLAYHGRDGVTVTGRVADVRPYIARASVYVVPLRIGGGSRLKILEAMAMGKCVLTTTIGMEGLDVEAGRDLCVSDAPEDFADAAATLAGDPERRKMYGAAARRRVEERYGWERIGARMNAFYERLVRESPRNRSPYI
jgi:sugar transferase (PEP-CTERM/EpsH1 system associated)